MFCEVQLTNDRLEEASSDPAEWKGCGWDQREGQKDCRGDGWAEGGESNIFFLKCETSKERDPNKRERQWC